MRHVRRSERGAALLTVLLLVAVIAVLAGTALEKMRLSTRLASNAAAIGQARAYAYAAETLATSRVNDLVGADARRVTLASGWSGRPFSLPVPGGLATARVVDGGNCFNLNGLVTPAEQGSFSAFTPARQQFARLMRLIGVPAGETEPIAAAAADWIDTDSTPVDQGAEDETYQRGETPYRTSNTLMADPSELRAVRGVTPEIYAKLRPWICALPKAELSSINVNTLLPEQAPLFAMLLPDTLSVEGARQMLLKRPAAGFESIAAFWKLPAQNAITPSQEAMAQTSVTTRWFALTIDVALGTTELQEQALIDASQPPARLVSRQWGDPA